MAILKIKWRLKNLQTGRDWINYKQCYTLDKADFQTKISFIQTNLKTTCTANHKQKHIRKQGKKVQSPDFQTHLVQLSLELWLERNRAKSMVRINKSLGL